MNWSGEVEPAGLLFRKSPVGSFFRRRQYKSEQWCLVAVKMTLDLLKDSESVADFSLIVRPSDIVVISPYKPDVENSNKLS